MKWVKSLFTAAVATVALGVSNVAQAADLNLFAWSEYVPQSVLDGFQKETGIKVNYEAYSSNEDMLAKLLSGAAKYDLVQPSEYVIEALIKAGKLQALDHAKIPNLKNLVPTYTQFAFDVGNKYSVPWMSGHVGIVYNKKKITDPITGFKDVFNGKYNKRLVILDDGREIVSWALATQGKDINVITPEALAGVRPMIAGWLKQVKIYDSDSPKDKLTNGDVDIGVVWSGEGAILLAQDADTWAWVLPVEGTHRFVDSLAIPVGAPNVEAAHKFIDYMLRPEVSVLISEEFPYTNPNAEARKLLPEAAQKNIASFPPDDAKLELYKDIGDAAKLIDELYTNVKSE